jgi:hypothetical protein
LLAPIYDWFLEGFETPDLIDAKALLGRCWGAAGRAARMIGKSHPHLKSLASDFRWG